MIRGEGASGLFSMARWRHFWTVPTPLLLLSSGKSIQKYYRLFFGKIKKLSLSFSKNSVPAFSPKLSEFAKTHWFRNVDGMNIVISVPKSLLYIRKMENQLFEKKLGPCWQFFQNSAKHRSPFCKPHVYLSLKQVFTQCHIVTT